MSFEKKYGKDKEHYDKKVLKTQKIKLYHLKHWIFDFGGVMIEGPKVVTRLFKIINSELGTSISKKDPYIGKLSRRLSAGLITSEEYLKKIFAKYSIKADVNYFLEVWFKTYTELTQLSPEMEEIVERLHKANYIVSLMSNTYDIHAKCNELRGFYDIFDNVYLSNELQMRKPEIEKYKYILNKLDAKPKQCIFIDDKLMNLVPARALGINVIQFKSFEQFQRHLTSIGIEDIDKNLRENIVNKYNIYKTSKKDFNKTKKKVKELKKELKKLKKKKKKSKYRKIKKDLRYAEAKFKKKKIAHEKQKQIKKQDLKPKLRLEQSQ